MSFEDLEPRHVDGDALKALLREDLDSYAVVDLQARIEALEGEIRRARQAIEAKSSQRNAADALFSFKGSSAS